MDLLARRQAVIDRHKTLESVKACPWSPENNLMKADMAKGVLPLSQRVTAVQDDDRVHVVGPDVDVVKAGLASFVERVAAKPDDDLVGHGLRFQDKIVKFCKRWSTAPELAFPTVEWNWCLMALGVEGVQCCLTGPTD
jgi:hypothetical protein